MENELLVLLEDRLGVGACRIDPEFEHAARAGEGARYASVAFDLAGIADIDDHDIAALRGLDRIGRAQGFNLRVGLIEQRLDAAIDVLGHCLSLYSSPLPPAGQVASHPWMRCGWGELCPFRYRTSSFIAASRPSIVIGYMRLEKIR